MLYNIKSINRISENSENSELSHNKKPVTMSNRFFKNLELLYERETIVNILTIFYPKIKTNVETTPSAINDTNK